MLPDIPNSWLQAGALAFTAAIALIAALAGQWGVVSSTLAVLVGVHAIRSKDAPPPGPQP